MSESRPKKRKVEFIESYWTGGEFGTDYQWNDNHGELIRCRDCAYYIDGGCGNANSDSPAENLLDVRPDWYCADGERRTDE